MRGWIRRTMGAFFALVMANNNWWIAAALVVAAIFGGFAWFFGWIASMSAGDPSLEGVTPYLQQHRLIMRPEMAPEWGHGGVAWLSGWCETLAWLSVAIAVLLIPIVIRDEIVQVARAIGSVFTSRKPQGEASGKARGTDNTSSAGGAASVISTLEENNTFKGKGPLAAFILTLLAWIGNETAEWWMARRARKLANKIVGE